MKKADYFPIYADDDHQPKSAEILMNYNNEGYSIYIRLQQRLLTAKSRTLEIEKLPAIAYDMHTSVDLLKSIVTKYFDNDGSAFWLDDLNERMAWYDAKYSASSEGGKKSSDNMTPEERSARAKKAGNASAESKKKRKSSEEIDAEEQVQTENLTKESLEVDNTQKPIKLSTKFNSTNTLSSDLVELTNTLSSDLVESTNNKNKNENRIRIESEKNENRNESELESEENQNKVGGSDLGGGVPVTVAAASAQLPSPTHTPTIVKDIEDDSITYDDITSISDVSTSHTPIKDSERSVANEKRQLSNNEIVKLFKPNNQVVTDTNSNTATRQYQTLTNQRYIDEIRGYTNSTYIKNSVDVKIGYEDLGKINAKNGKFKPIREYEKIMYWHCFQRSPATNLFNEGVDVNKIVNKEMTYTLEVISEVNKNIEKLIADIKEDPDTYAWLLTKTLEITSSPVDKLEIPQ